MSRKALAWLVVAAALVASPPAAARPLVTTPPPGPVQGGGPPSVTAQGWILYDDTFGLVLAAYQADTPRPMASTTKIMTALLALESGNLERPIPVTEQATEVGESEIGLEAGEIWPLSQLITALLVRSANDAAMAIAEALGGDVSGFVDLMNWRAAELGLSNTHFANPHGLDEPGHYSTPRDLLTLTLKAMEYPEFAEAVSSRRIRFSDAPDGTPRVAENTNRLLTDYPGAIGVKTGYTGRAGEVLVGAAERNGRRLYAVVMGSEDRLRDVAALLDYGFDGYPLLTVVAVEGETSSALASAAPEAKEVAGFPSGRRTTAEPRIEPPQLPGLRRALWWMFEVLGGG